MFFASRLLHSLLWLCIPCISFSAVDAFFLDHGSTPKFCLDSPAKPSISHLRSSQHKLIDKLGAAEDRKRLANRCSFARKRTKIETLCMLERSNNQLFKLGAVGFILGPGVDALHNQVLLVYHSLPIQIKSPIGIAESSLLIPPLLGITYAILGGVLPRLAERAIGGLRLESVGFTLSRQANAALAVASTVAIIRASESLVKLQIENIEALGILGFLAFVQWAVLDGALSSLIIGLVLAIVGPIAEIPFMAAGCWEYLHPDYWPLTAFGLGPDAGANWAGLSALTGPCYFAVTTDAIALGRLFGDVVDKMSDQGHTKTPQD